MPHAKKLLLDGATVIVTGLALWLGGIRVVETLQGPPDPFAATEVEGWREYADEGHRLGPPDAPVKVVEFLDFECPFCRSAADDLEELAARHQGDVAIVYRHRPLPIHANAGAAAHAAECAALQGRFGAYHDLLFTQADSIGEKDWVSFATESGVEDLPGFNHCIRGGEPVVSERLRTDSVAAVELGVEATPTFLINHLRIEGYPGLERLDAVVRELLADIR